MLSFFSSSFDIEYQSNISLAEGYPKILAVKYVWNSIKFCDFFTYLKLTNPESSQNFIWGCLSTVYSMYLLTKNFWQTEPISSTTLVTLIGAAKATRALILKVMFLLSRQRRRQLPPKLVPTRQIYEWGQQAVMRYNAVQSSPKLSPVKGMGLVISLLKPLLFRHTQQQPSSEAGFISSFIQLFSLPPVSPCMTNKMGGLGLSEAGGSQSSEIWPPSSKNILSLLNQNGNIDYEMLQTD